MDPHHQDVRDRHLLNRHVRYYGDDVCAVIAENEVAANQAIRAIQVEYEELPFVLDVQEAMQPGAPQLHEKYPNNILNHTTMAAGSYAEAIQEPGLIRVEGWYDTPTVQHCHIENHIGCVLSGGKRAAGRHVVHADPAHHPPHRRVRRWVSPWGDVRIIKPYIGGGFGNKQDALYEPLCAWCCTQRRRSARSSSTAQPRGDVRLQPCAPRHPHPHYFSWLRQGRYDSPRKSVECLLQSGRLRLARSLRSSPRRMGSFNQHYPCPNMLRATPTPCITCRPAGGRDARLRNAAGRRLPMNRHAEECSPGPRRSA